MDRTTVVAHVDNHTLLEFAAGVAKLSGWQRDHLQKCELCLSVACVLIRQPFEKEAAQPSANSAA